MPAHDTRQAIMDAAQALIQRRGANGISYQHISDIVGIRKASIHHYFPTKEDLIEALLDRFADKFDEELLRLDATHRSAAERLQAYVGLFEQTFANGDAVCLYGMLGAELASLGPDAVAGVSTFYRRNVDWLRQLLRDGREDGSLEFEGDPASVALMVFSLLEGGMLVARADRGPEQYRILTRDLLAQFGIERKTTTSTGSAA